MRHTGRDAAEIPRSDSALLASYGEPGLPTVDHANLLMGMGVCGYLVPRQRGIEDLIICSSCRPVKIVVSNPGICTNTGASLESTK